MSPSDGPSRRGIPGGWSPDRRVVVRPDAAAVADAAAAFVAARAVDAVAARGVFRLALAGGSTPLRTYERLAEIDGSGPGRAIPWHRVHVYWGDERFVPAGDPDSNAAAARAALLDRVAVRPGAIHPIAGPEAVATARASASAYAAILARSAAADPAGAPLDLVLLGLGEDGHTASIFPGDAPGDRVEERTAPAGAERSPVPDAPAWVEAVLGPVTRPPRERITLTLAAIAASREAVFIATGASKREVLARVLGADSAEGMDAAGGVAGTNAGRGRRLPAALVRARCGVTWLVDRAASGS